MNTQIIVLAVCMVAIAACVEATETPSKFDEETKKAAMAVWAQLTPKQQDCIKEKWQKNAEELKLALKNCHEKKGGMPCVKEISLIKECFA